MDRSDEFDTAELVDNLCRIQRAQQDEVAFWLRLKAAKAGLPEMTASAEKLQLVELSAATSSRLCPNVRPVALGPSQVRRVA